jgi:hypothetical protein
VNIVGYRIRSMERTHVGTDIIRAVAVMDNDRERECWVVRRDEEHYTVAWGKTQAFKKALQGGLDVRRPTLVWMQDQPAVRRMFPMHLR